MKILLTTLFFQAFFTVVRAQPITSEMIPDQFTYLPQWIQEREQLCRVQAPYQKSLAYLKDCLDKVQEFANEVLTCEESSKRFKQVVQYDKTLIKNLLSEHALLPTPVNINDLFFKLTAAAELLFNYSLSTPKWKLYAYNATYRNAHAVTDGTIVISQGFWMGEDSFSDHEIAAILAHEISHVVLRHFHRQGCIALEWMGTDTDLQEALKEMSNDFNLSEMRGKAWSQASQRHEFEADQLAAIILLKAGLDPKLMSKALTKLKPKEDVWFSSGSHPDMNERIRRLP